MIVHDNKVLLVRSPKWRGYWTTSGGHVEYGESLKAALKREMKEELGLEVDIVRPLVVQEAINSPLFWKKGHFIMVDFLCEVKSDDVKIDGREITSYKWVDPREALKMRVEPYMRRLIVAYLEKETRFHLIS